MDIFNPLVTLLLFVIILRLGYNLKKVEKKNEMLTECIVNYLEGEECVEDIMDFTDEAVVREIDFDNKILQMREELGMVQEAYIDMINTTPTIADVLDEEVYNLSRDEIILLEQQLSMEDLEYAE